MKKEFFFEAIASVKLTEVLEIMFGSGIHFHNTQLFFNPSNKTRLPYWHRDMQYSPIEDAIQSDEQHRMLREPANKSLAPLAFRAVRDQGNDCRHTGCLSKIANTEIRSL